MFYQLAASNEDYGEVCAENEKLKSEVAKLLSQLETSKTENEHASQLVRFFASSSFMINNTVLLLCIMFML